MKTQRIKKIFPNFQKLKNCASKIELMILIGNLSQFAKDIIKFYMTECFILDVFSRNIIDKHQLFAKRQFFYDMIDDPKILENMIFYNNNIIKNFCCGCMNFIEKYFYDIEYQFKKKKFKRKQKKIKKNISLN